MTAYSGGKQRIGRMLAQVILSHSQPRQHYCEPFCGMLGVLRHVSAAFQQCHCSDIHPDVIAMWQAVQRDGWRGPDAITREVYDYAKALLPGHPLRAFVGFGSGYSGRFFQWFTDSETPAYRAQFRKSTAQRGNDGIDRVAPTLGNVSFRCCDFGDATVPPGAVVYCDPPYADTQPYRNIPAFQRDAFWRQVVAWATRGNCTVFVSEQNDPPPGVLYDTVWERAMRRSTRHPSQRQGREVRERLFRITGADASFGRA